jgi:hypothetical protein
MADTGWLYPAKGENVYPNSDLTSLTSWANPNYVIADDSNYASQTYDKDFQGKTHIAGFNFNLSSIPAEATISGIEVVINRYSSTADICTDSVISLVKVTRTWIPESGTWFYTFTIAGDNKASASYWETSLTDKTYGGSSDLWNTGYTRDDLVDTDYPYFGVILKANFSAGSAYIDYIKIKVYYTEEESEPTIVPQMLACM